MNTPALPRLPERDPNSHKGDFGRLLILGGSRGMAGSISLTGSAALRSGAGLVTVAVPDRCLETVASYDRCYTTVGLPDDANGFYEVAGTRLPKMIGEYTAIGCGPGMRTGEGAIRIVKFLCEMVTDLPRVFDADALNCLAGVTRWKQRISGPAVLTPHPGEWSRLCGVDPVDREAQKSAAIEAAAACGVVIVLKGYGTIITDGDVTVCNETGNAGMATGGSGDVLTGIITALLGQGMTPLDAAQLGVHVHGLAGDIATSELGQISVTAKDVLDHLPNAFMALNP